MHARHQSPSARSADGVDIVIVKDDPGVGQRVNVRGRNLIGAVKTHIVPALKSIHDFFLFPVFFFTKSSATIRII